MSLPPVVALEGVVRHYAWGSPTAIPRLLGREPDGRPVAELWLGAHPDDPAGVPAHDTTLDRLVAADPAGVLGEAVVGRFGPQLPFLLKVLAPDTALSLQVHPTLEQARAGFAAEDAAGVPRDAPHRNYRDANHKPELVCALTPFTALCGFRPVPATLALLDEFALPELSGVRGLLAGEDGLRTAFTHLLTMPAPAPLVSAVVARAGEVAASGGEWAQAAAAVVLAGTDFPGDVGAVLALLLNAVALQPGEAIYLGAGNVHAYLRGVGVEIMATSDNVLRCGLTPKHVDVPELLRVTEFVELADPRCPTVDVPAGHAAFGFDVPVEDFALMSVDLTAFGHPVGIGDPGPHVVLCTEGAATVSYGGTSVALTPGRAAFVRARPEPFSVEGTGRVFAATVNL